MAGAGVFGGHHAKKLAEADGVRLVRIYDADPVRAASRAEEHGAEGVADLDAFLPGLDAVVVATPATSHAEIATAALKAGCHVLVEKPLALTLGDADALIALAAARGLVLQVGHQEVYVVDGLGLLDREGVRHVRSRRLNKPSGRAGDVSVVMDLMIHDLDLLARLSGSDEAYVTRCEAVGPAGGPADFVAADLRVGAITAELSASRLEDSAVRDLTLATAEGQVGLDFLTRTITNDTGLPLAASMGQGPALADPLGHGTRLFLAAIRDGTPRGVTGEEGRAALALALTVEAAAQEVL